MALTKAVLINATPSPFKFKVTGVSDPTNTYIDQVVSGYRTNASVPTISGTPSWQPNIIGVSGMSGVMGTPSFSGDTQVTFAVFTVPLNNNNNDE